MPNDKDTNQEFHLTIVDPDKVIFEDNVKRIIAPGSIQDIAILPDHTPLYSDLKAGEIEITSINDKIEKIPIDSGVIRVRRNKVSIIVGF